MHHHPYFDLWLHGEDELVSLVKSGIRERVTLHEWPLSCVQRLTLADGRKLIYKTQFGPTVEPEFYAAARSELLPWAQTVYRSDGHACTLSEYIDASLLEDIDLPEEDVVRIGGEVLAQIGAIEGDLPHYLDVSDETRWEAFMAALLTDLGKLIDGNKFALTDRTSLRTLERWAFSEPVLAVIRGTSGYVHGDLSGDNLFLLPDGYRVVDWQRPLRGPTDLDLALLIESLGFDPRPHVGAGVMRIWNILSIHWLAQCKLRWFPGGESYDRQVAQLVAGLQDGSRELAW
jgi:hypothetical protein